MDKLLSVDSYWTTVCQGPARIAAAQSALRGQGPDSLEVVWLRRVEAWARNTQQALHADAVGSPVGTLWLLLPEAVCPLDATSSALVCKLCCKCRSHFAAMDARGLPQPTMPPNCRANGLWGGPEPEPLRNLSWLGKRIIRLARPVLSLRTLAVPEASGASSDPRTSPLYTTGNCLIFPQRGDSIAQSLGVLPPDLACDVSLRCPPGSWNALDADPAIRVDLATLRSALAWLLSNNWLWLDATRSHRISPSGHYLGDHFESLLQQYARSVDGGIGVPRPLREMATEATSPTQPDASEGPVEGSDAAVLEPDADDDTPLALWAEAMRKYEAINAAEEALRTCTDTSAADTLYTRRRTALLEAVVALRRLASDSTDQRLATYAQQLETYEIHVPPENELLSVFEPTLWARCFPDCFYRGDVLEPRYSSSNLGIARRWFRTLFARADNPHWANNREFAAVAANALLRRSQLAAINSWLRHEGGAKFITGTLATLSLDDFVTACHTQGRDFCSLREAAHATRELPGPLQQLFRNMTLVLRHVDGSETMRAGFIFKMRALRVWHGCSYLFFTLNPSDHRSPLLASFVHSQTGERQQINVLRDAPVADRLRLLSALNPYAAMRTVRLTIERTLDTLLHCVDSGGYRVRSLPLDLNACKTEPGAWGHISAFFGAVECTKRLREHAHFLVHLVGYQHPAQLFAESAFETRFRQLWQATASIVHHGQEHFAATAHPSAGLIALRSAPLLPVSPKQRDLLGPRANDVAAQQLEARGAAVPTAPGPTASPSLTLVCHDSRQPAWAWPAAWHDDPAVDAAEWASQACIASNDAALRFGNHICLPATCHKRTPRARKICRMLFWHWTSDGKAAHRLHGLPIFPAWNNAGLPPVCPYEPHRGLPALPRSHPFHYKMNPAIALGADCNHDLGILARFPAGDELADRAKALDEMILAICDHEYYAGGYLAKDQDAGENVLRLLHDAKQSFDKRQHLNAEAPTDPIPEAGRKLLFRLISSMNKRYHWGMPSVYAYLVGKPMYYCSHRFTPLPFGHFLTRMCALVDDAHNTPLPAANARVEACLPLDHIACDPPPTSTQPTYLTYDYPWRDRNLEQMPWYFFYAATQFVNSRPAHGWCWPCLLDDGDCWQRHPAYTRRAKDARFYVFSRRGGDRVVLRDPASGTPLMRYDHYRRVLLDEPWSIPELVGSWPPFPTDDADGRARGHFSLFAFLLFRPWRSLEQALHVWLRPVHGDATKLRPDQLWQGLADAYALWKDQLQSIRVAAQTDPPAPASGTWWDCLTYEKLRNFELAARRQPSRKDRVPTDASGAPLPQHEPNATSRSPPPSPPPSPTDSSVSLAADAGACDAEPDVGDVADLLPPPPAADHLSHITSSFRYLSRPEKAYANDLLQRLAASSQLLPPAVPDAPAVGDPHAEPTARAGTERLRSVTAALVAQRRFFSELDSVDPDAVDPATLPDDAPTASTPTVEVPHPATPHQQLFSQLRREHPPLPITNDHVLRAALWLLQNGLFYIQDHKMYNVKQVRAFLLAAFWLQTTLIEDAVRRNELPPSALGSSRTPPPTHLVVVGGAGSGKTTVLLVIDKFFQYYFGPQTTQKSAPTITAARLIGGNTIHALYKLPRGRLSSKDGRLSSTTTARLRRTWRHARCQSVDEISMASPRHLYQMDQRARVATRRNELFGGLFWLTFSCGQMAGACFCLVS